MTIALLGKKMGKAVCVIVLGALFSAKLANSTEQKDSQLRELDSYLLKEPTSTLSISPDREVLTESMLVLGKVLQEVETWTYKKWPDSLEGKREKIEGFIKLIDALKDPQRIEVLKRGYGKGMEGALKSLSDGRMAKQARDYLAGKTKVPPYVTIGLDTISSIRERVLRSRVQLCKEATKEGERIKRQENH